jgi:hypothetical protein
MMKSYIGAKIINAKPMNLGDYNEYRGWKILENEDPEKQGYLVQYPDGYLSWSPKEVFEQAYREIDIREAHLIDFKSEIDPVCGD